MAISNANSFLYGDSAAGAVRPGGGRRHLGWVCAMYLAFPVSLCSPVAGAQAALDEVVVTATKREQSEQDVGMSMSVLDAKQLSTFNFAQSTSVFSQMANVVEGNVQGAGNNPNISLRGVGLNDFNDGTESAVAVYADDIYYVPVGAGSFPTYDLQRVEVLRGPQGTLFGRNATAGLIHYVSERPKHENSAYVEGGAGDFGQWSARGAFNTIFTDTLTGRLSFFRLKNDGWIKHEDLSKTVDSSGKLLYPGTSDQPNAGASDLLGIRGQLLWEPVSEFHLLAKFQYDNSQGTTNIFHPVAAVSDANGRVVFPSPDGSGPQSALFGPHCQQPSGDCFLETAKNVTAYGNDHGNNNTSRTAVIRADWNVGRATLTSVSGYNSYSRNFLEDCDGSPWNACQNSYRFRSEQYSEELRGYIPFDRMRITTGLYGLSQDGGAHYAAPVNLSRVLPLPFPLIFQADYDTKINSYAAFNNVEFDVTPELTAIAGGRISRDEKTFNETLRQWYPRSYAGGVLSGSNADSWYFNGPGVPIGAESPQGDCGNPAGAALAGGDCLIAQNLFNNSTAPGLTTMINNLWTAKGELDWKPSKEFLVYGFVNRGVKAGGFNNGYYEISSTPQQIPYHPEVLLDYELGFKSTLLDGRAHLNAGVFYYDYRGKHTIVYLSSPTSQGDFTLNRNARLKGGEVEFQIQATEHIYASIGAGAIASKVDNIATATGYQIKDAEALLAPKFSGNALVRYETGFVAGSKVGLQLDGSGHTGMWGDSFNDPVTRLQGLWITNARVDWTDPSGRLRVSGYVTNLTDELKPVSSHIILGIADAVNYQYTPPRWWGVNVGYSF
jgi:iron complex outermembrane recepter protein